MRRKDRQMSAEFGLQIIDKAQYGVLSMITKEKEPYGIPLSMARDGRFLYFHSAKDGRKVQALKDNPYVVVTFVGHVSIPENYTLDELDALLEEQAGADQLISGVFTTEYESAVVRGVVTEVLEHEDKVKAMYRICERYTPSKMKYFNLALTGVDQASVYKIEIEEITAKRKKYDENGEEMKWGRT